ncbi:hypothetical protein PanWU01x14_239400 [Parasponia andersonii]|uniref:Uncharacterized protein n=1 Tax=Parasponia andersonii TaxID=3476 RepID=A0A2P5BH77_PARAD|nr:hypothetical protein PanWU01x14_239400 [Parasponia andersonii]
MKELIMLMMMKPRMHAIIIEMIIMGGGTLRWRSSSCCGATKLEMLENEVELGLGEVNLALEVLDDAVAAANGVGGAGVGLEDDGAHGVVLGDGGVELPDDLGDVADAEELVRVEELPLRVVGEVRGENAVRGALPALVLACSASLAVAASF